MGDIYNVIHNVALRSYRSFSTEMYKLPYIRNHPRKKSFANHLLYHSLQENFCDSGNLIYKNSGRD